MKRFLSEYILHVALGAMALLFIPLGIVLLPIWGVGKLAGTIFDRLGGLEHG